MQSCSRLGTASGLPLPAARLAGAPPAKARQCNTLLQHTQQPIRVRRTSARLDTTHCRATKQVLVKVCGITNEADATFAAQQGASMIGMIMWPKAKRAVSAQTAAAIAAAAKQHGAQPVGVFVDEDAASIIQRCRAAGIFAAQLHGDASRRCLNDIPPELQVVYVLQANDHGHIITPLPDSGHRSIEWLLVDGMTGGSGKSFDWSQLQAPTSLPTKGWLLAGGLNPGNVAQAVSVAHPTAVDVSSGVCGPDGLRKDHTKVQDFISQAKGAARV